MSAGVMRVPTKVGFPPRTPGLIRMNFRQLIGVDCTPRSDLKSLPIDIAKDSCKHSIGSGSRELWRRPSCSWSFESRQWSPGKGE
jgi:hypothetical protein